MSNDVDPLRQIADSLQNLERIYAEQQRESQSRQKDFDERQLRFDERQKKWDAWNDKNLWNNQWVQPGQIIRLIEAVALVILAVAVAILARR
jgi:hypothetical protein